MMRLWWCRPSKCCGPSSSGRKDIQCDVLVSGNDKNAREQVIRLVEAAGMKGYHAGLISNAAAANYDFGSNQSQPTV